MIQNYFSNMLNKGFSIFNDLDFKETRKALSGQMKLLAKDGYVKEKKRASSIDIHDEDQMWDKGILGSSNPHQLVHTLIYTLGIHLSLRAGKEQHDLEYGGNSQIKLILKDRIEVLHYTERISKNKSFGLKNSTCEPKVTYIYPRIDKPERCAIFLYKKYISHRPDENVSKQIKSFYLSPIKNPRTNIWYKSWAFIRLNP